MRHKRRGILEVNLTSLLDVLFCILFIVMMANIENEHDIKNESQQQIQEIQEQLQAEIAAYRAEAATYQAQMESYDVYHTEAIIITMQNLQEGSNYVLKIYEGLEKVESDSIRLGPNLSESVNRSIRRYFNDIINSLKSPEGLSVPIYVVFHRNANYIQTKQSEEIDSLLKNLASENKGMFYKVLDINE